VESDHVSYRVAAGVAHISLTRPEVRNVLAATTRTQLLAAFARAVGDPDAHAVLLGAAGDHFSAGADLVAATPRTSLEEDVSFLAAADQFHQTIRQTPLPVVAAARGYCLGAGLLLAACADFLIAGDTAMFGLPEGRLGLVGASPLVGLVGRQWAKFLIMTGENITGARAREIGLVLTVVSDRQLDDQATELARRLARMPRDGVRLNKAAVDAVADAADDEAARQAGIAHDAATLRQAANAAAPDGRTFRAILAEEGMPGLKAARDQQYVEPWLDQ
jgi:enoyl-CoA hydratase/carnithine racemase